MTQVPMNLPDSLGPASSANPAPAIISMHTRSTAANFHPQLSHTLPPCPLCLMVDKPLCSPYPQSMTQHSLKTAQHSAQAYDPLCGQGTCCQSGGGWGRTCGVSNYRFQEIKVLLNLVNEELLIASMGWCIIGSQFQDWASVSSHPAQINWLLELKFKQVRFSSTNKMS